MKQETDAVDRSLDRVYPFWGPHPSGRLRSAKDMTCSGSEASDAINEAKGLVNKRSVTVHVDGRRVREFNRTKIDSTTDGKIHCLYLCTGWHRSDHETHGQ